MSAQTTSRRPGIAALLSDPKFELMPFSSFDDQLSRLPDGATVAITTSPKLGLETTLDRAVQAAEAGYVPIPHIAARFVEDRDHVEAIASRLADAGVEELFVVGGDREEPIGAFDSSLGFLEALEETGYAFEEVGIAGYPEGHAFLSDETLAAAMAAKEPYATFVVTQLCYDPETIVAWIEGIRDQGIELTVDVGVPGVLKYQRLLEISRRVGVGQSIHFLRSTSGIFDFVRQFVGSRGTYTPDALVDGIAPYVDDPAYGIRTAHLYTFNQVADTERWRHERLR